MGVLQDYSKAKADKGGFLHCDACDQDLRLDMDEDSLSCDCQDFDVARRDGDAPNLFVFKRRR